MLVKIKKLGIILILGAMLTTNILIADGVPVKQVVIKKYICSM